MLRAEILPELPDARVEEDFAELQRVAELLEVERLRRLAEIERRGLFGSDGHLSAAAWLVSRFKVAWGAARALEEMPATRRALEAGDVSLSAVRVLVATREADPEAFGRSEEHLLEAARIHSMGDLQRVVAYWREALERERSLDGEERIRARRRLHASISRDGARRCDPDPGDRQTLLTAPGP
jgi:hypothetical protein